MTTHFAEHLAQLRAQAWFQALLKEEMIPLCPSVPSFTPNKTESDWKYGSGMRDGYLLALKHLGVDDID